MSIFEDTFTPENSVLLAEYIVNNFSDGTNRVIDYDFSLQSGVDTNADSQLTNLFFRFDTEPNTVPRAILDVLIDEDIEPTEERQILFANFLEDAKHALVNQFGNEFREKIRKVVFDNDKVTPEIVPIANLKCLHIDISDVPEEEQSVLVIKKNIPKHQLDEQSEYNLESRPISQELVSIRRETGKSFDEIVAEKKAEEDISYIYVDSVEENKGLYECHIDLFADFSFVMPTGA